MQFQRYRIKSSDTLVTIAQEKYGDPRLYSEIAKQNGIRNPDLIYEGKLIRLPKVLAGKPLIGDNGKLNGESKTPAKSSPNGTKKEKPMSGAEGSLKNTRGDGRRAKVSPELQNKVEHTSDDKLYVWLYHGRIKVGSSMKDNDKGFPRLPAGEFKEFMRAVEQEAFNRKFPKRAPALYNSAEGIGPASGTEPVDASGQRLTRDKLSDMADPFRKNQKK